MTQVIAVSKRNKDVTTSTNPNDFIFHSAFNTFKIVKQGTYTINIPGSTSSGSYRMAHRMWYIPLIHAFALYSSNICLPNEKLYSPLGSDIYTFAFDELKSDVNDIIFTVSNNSGSQITVTFRYYIFEVPL